MAETARGFLPGFAPAGRGGVPLPQRTVEAVRRQIAPDVFQRLLEHPGFQKASDPEKALMFQDLGMGQAEAEQQVIDMRRQAPAPSVTDRVGPFTPSADPLRDFTPRGPSPLTAPPPGERERFTPSRPPPRARGPQEEKIGTKGPLTSLAVGAKNLLVEGGPATAGAVAGGVIAPVFRVPAPVGEAIGGALGEAGRQFLTKGPFNLEQIIAAGVVPGASGRVTRGLRGRFPAGRENVGQMNISPRRMQQAAQFVPGTSGAFSDIAQETVGEIPGRIRGMIPSLTGTLEGSDELIERGLNVGPGGRVPLQNTQQALKDVQLDLPPGFPLSDIKPEILEPMQALVDIAENVELGQGLNIRHFNATRRHVGQIFGKLSRGPQKDAMRRLTAGILQDLDDAVTRGLPGAEDLRLGLDVARLEFAAEDFQELLDTIGLGRVRQGERDPTFQLNRVLTELRKVERGRPSKNMQLFAGAFKGPQGQQELEDIIDLVADLNETVLVLPPPKGQAVGSSSTIAAGAAGVAVTEALGLPVPAAAAAAGGIATRAMLNRLLMSRTGRRALRQVLTEGADVDLIKATGIFIGNLVQQELLQGRPGGRALQDFGTRLESN